MANFPPAVVSAAVSILSQAAGGQVRYTSGRWAIVVNGVAYSVDQSVAADFNNILAQTAARMALNNVHLPPTNGHPPNPNGSGSPSGGAAPNGGGSPGGGGAPNGGHANSNWLVKALNSPTAQNLLKPINDFDPTAAVNMTRANIRQASDTGGAAARGLADAASGAARQAFDAGAKIGQALLEGALRPFGASGAAVAEFGGVVTRTLGQGLETGGRALGGLAEAGGRVIGAGAGVAGAGIGAAAGGLIGMSVGSAPGALAGAALGSLVGVALMNIAQAIAGVISTALAEVGRAFGAFGELVTGAFSAIGNIIRDVTEAASSYARRIYSISHQSGASIGSTTKAVTNLSALGINPDEVGGLRQNSYIQGVKAKAWGVKGEFGSEEFIQSFGARYRSMADKGGAGLMQAQAVAKDMGAEKYVEAAYMDPSALKEQLGYVQGLQNALGMNAQQMQGFAQDWTLLTARISTFAEMVRVKLAAEALPFLSNMMSRVTQFIGNNADEIGQAIRNGVIIGATALASLPDIALRGFVFILRGVARLMNGFANMVQQFAEGRSAAENWISGLLGGVDNIIRAFRLMASVVIGVLTAIAVTAIINNAAMIASLKGGFPAAAKAAAMAVLPALATVSGAAIAGGVAGVAAAGLTYKGSERFQTHLQKDFKAYADDHREDAGILAARVKRGANSVTHMANGVEKFRKDHDTANWGNNMAATMVQSQQVTNEKLDQIANNTAPLKDKKDSSLSSLMGLLNNNVVDQSFDMATR